VLTIDSQGVLVDAASLEKPDKRFEILLKVSEDPLSFTMLSAHFQPDGEALKFGAEGAKPRSAPLERNNAREKAEDWGYQVPEEDLDEKLVEDFAKYTRSTENGIEILAELPKDSPARKYGAQGGEIIKTINGEAVKSMSDVRRIVRTQYDAGTREFKVGYERDGVPDERTFKAPEKK
jgi:membrane-associated protease RseP (regulator of RpoE activity)